MPDNLDGFSQWLAQAQITECSLTPDQRGLLLAAFRFRQLQGTDYYSTRLLTHFLLHAQSGLKVAQIARLVRLSRPTASRQQHCSSKEAIQQAHHRMDGRPYGKLLPRYAGPIAQFLFAHPDASRADLLDFISQTFDQRVSTVALSKFLKKFGLDRATRQTTTTARPADTTVGLGSTPATAVSPPLLPEILLPPSTPIISQGQPVPTPAPPFSLPGRNQPVPSCCSPRPSTGWISPRPVFATKPTLCRVVC